MGDTVDALTLEAIFVALPVAAHVGGEVIGRRRLGVCTRVDGVPNAVAPAEITAMLRGMEPPAMGAFVDGDVIDHAHHSRRVKIRPPG